jgi:hypothetical protein
MAAGLGSSRVNPTVPSLAVRHTCADGDRRIVAPSSDAAWTNMWLVERGWPMLRVPATSPRMTPLRLRRVSLGSSPEKTLKMKPATAAPPVASGSQGAERTP